MPVTFLRGRGARFAVTPLVQVASAALSALAIILASRQGQLGDIAAFAAGGGVAAIVGVISGGGTSLLFVTGTDVDRQAVRWVRWRFTAPTMVGISLVVNLLISRASDDVSMVGMSLGSLAVAFQNLASIDTVTFQRNQRMFRWGSCVIASRVIPVMIVGIGISYSLAMAIGPLVLLIALIPGRNYSDGAELRRTASPYQILRLAYHPRFGTIAILDAVVIRLPFVFAPLIVDAAAAGGFATLLTAQQSLTAVITTSLYTIMTFRSTKLHTASATFYHRLEVGIVIASIPITVVAIVGCPFLADLLALQSFPEFATVWVVLALGIPLVTISRSLQYRSMSERNESRAIVQLASTAAIVVTVCIVAWWLDSIVILTASVAVGEGTGISAWLLAAFLQRHHARMFARVFQQKNLTKGAPRRSS